MTRIIIAAISISVLGYLAYRTMYARGAAQADVEAPTQQLENVRGAAKRIEQNDQQHVEDIEHKTSE